MFVTPVDALAVASLWCRGRGSTRVAGDNGQCHLPLVQPGARRHGNRGISGNRGIVDSLTYRIYGVLSGSNPPSPNPLTFVFKHLAGGVGSQRAMRLSLSRRAYSPAAGKFNG